MPRPKKTIAYTVAEHPGVLITVESPKDNEVARQKALDEILEKMNDPEDETFDKNSFPNGLGIQDLILVETPSSSSIRKGSGEEIALTPLQQAAKEIAQLAKLRIELQSTQESAQKYVSLIEALFGTAPLSEEQIELASEKDLPKTLEKLATAKVEFDQFRPVAENAWGLLKPAMTEVVPPQPTALAPGKHESNGEESAIASPTKPTAKTR